MPTDHGELTEVRSDVVDLEVRGRVLVLTLNRPDVCNAMDTRVYRDLMIAMDRARQAPGIGCLLLTGAGRYFSAGRDLSEWSGDRPSPTQAFQRHRYWQETAMPFYSYVSRYPKALITAVNGPAIGGGAVTAFLGDISVAADDAYFLVPEIDAGRPAPGAALALPRLVGRAHAMKVVLLAERMPAADAAAIGLISEVVPRADVMTVATDYAERVAAKSSTAIELFKASLQAGPWGESEKESLLRTALVSLGRTEADEDVSREFIRGRGIRVRD